MFLFFVPRIVLPLGAQILAKRLAAHSSPPPLSTSAGTSTKPTTTGVPHENRCDSVSCAIYTWDDTAKTMLAAPENAKKALTLDDPSPESLAWLVNLPTLTHLALERASRIDDFTPLGKLTELDYLDVWNSKETTLAPLADLVKLETLKLQNSNALVDLGAVASLPNLKELRFMGTSVTDYGPIGMATHLRTLEILMVRAPVDPLGKLASLRDLTLDLKGSAAGLAPLVSLRSLNLWQSNVTDPAQLGKLIGVETLDIPSAKLTTIAFAATMRHLRTIDVDYDSGVSDLAPLRGLPELTDVEASGTSVVDIAPLATCPKLQRLNLEKTKVTTLAPLAAAKLLTTLSVAGADVHDLMPLSKLPVLKTITVQKGQIPDAAMTAFKAAAPTVRIVVTKP
jgi:internalin A